MEQVMQTVLVDIYNYCHRNKALARQNLPMGSSISSNDTNVMVRQVSTDSNNEYECIVTDDVFHPEGGKQTVTPFSPVYTDPNEIALKFPLQFKDGSEETKTITSNSVGLNAIQSLDNQPTPTSEQELISAISSSPPSIPKETGVHILNKPPPSSSERRANRFSVTKIFDSIVNHATGVSHKLSNVSLENKGKKHMIPKDEMSKSTNNDIISNIKTKTAEPEPMATTTATSSQPELINNKSESSTSLSLDCSTPLPNGNEMCINSPIEIIEVDENHHILDNTTLKVVSSDDLTNTDNKSDVTNDDDGEILVTQNDTSTTTTSNLISESPITSDGDMEKEEEKTENIALNDLVSVEDAYNNVEVERTDVDVVERTDDAIVEAEPLDLGRFIQSFQSFLL